MAGMNVRALSVLALLGVAACGQRGAAVAEVAPGNSAVLLSAVEGCTASPPAGRDIAESGLTAAGWTASRREVVKGAARQSVSATDPRENAPDELESTTWTKAGSDSTVTVTRGLGLAGNCQIDVKADGRAVTGDFEKTFGRKPDRAGVRPAGGDQLTGPNGEPTPSLLWQLPKHDVYMLRFGNGTVRAEIVAMPDRAALDRYDPDHPSMRIHVEGEQ